MAEYKKQAQTAPKQNVQSAQAPVVRAKIERLITDEESKLSPSTVRRALRDLRKAGVIESEQRYRENGGKSSLLYKLDAQ